MRFGVCGGRDRTAGAAAAGYDYIELSVAGDLAPEKPEADVMPALEQALGGKIAVEAFNSFVPADLRVTGDGVDPARQVRYAREAFKRAARLGGSVIVFGSGGARQVPDGFDRAVAFRQIGEFLARIADDAAANGIVIAIEPLRGAECNILNSVAEAVEVAEKVDHPAVSVLSDFYHVDFDEQPFDETGAAGPLLRHIHVAAPKTRHCPSAADIPILTRYFLAARQAGYDARVSLECGWDDFEREGEGALAATKAAWNASADA